MTTVKDKLVRGQWISLIAGLVGTAVCLGALSVERRDFFRAYHVGYLFWWHISMGFLALALLRCVVRSQWGNATWPYLKSNLVTLPLVAVLYLPIVLGLSDVFPWASEAAATEHAGNAFQAVYFQSSFFYGRALAYFAVWIACAYLAARTGTSTGAARMPRRFVALAIMALVLTTTFAAFDWGMSLEPAWYSTIYGALVLVSGVVGAMAVLILSVALMLRVPRLADVRIREVVNDLGNLLLAFLMIWAYFAFSQYLIIWSGNLPSEVTWYLRRSEGSWQVLLIMVVVLHFVLPFLMLLSRQQKRRPRSLARIALLLLIGNLIETTWTFAPSLADHLFEFHWSFPATLVAIGGWWTLAYTWALKQALLNKDLMGVEPR